MNYQRFAVQFSLASFIGLTAATAPVLAVAKPAPHMQAKISMSAARALAQKAFPGTIVKAELERERGGSGLRYSFDMRKGNSWHEVGVDAMTGQVLENSREGANPKD